MRPAVGTHAARSARGSRREMWPLGLRGNGGSARGSRRRSTPGWGARSPAQSGGSRGSPLPGGPRGALGARGPSFDRPLTAAWDRLFGAELRSNG